MIVCAVSAKALRGPPLCRGLPTWPVGPILRVVRVPFLFKCVVFRSTFRDRSSSTHFGVLASVCGVRTLQSRLLSFEHFLSGTLSITRVYRNTGFFSFACLHIQFQSRGCPRAPLATSAAASRPETPFSLRSLSLSARRGIGSRNPADARRLQRPELGTVVSRRGDVLQSRNRPRARLATCSTLFCKL